MLCSRCIFVEWVKAHSQARLSLRPYVTASHLLAVLFTVGQHHDNDNNNEMSVGLHLIDSYADEHISQMLDKRQKQGNS